MPIEVLARRSKTRHSELSGPLRATQLGLRWALLLSAAFINGLLALIRDETRYPYPCFPPHASAENQRRYIEAQELIEADTQAIRGLVNSRHTVDLPKLLVEHLALIRWAREARTRASAKLSLDFDFEDAGLPTWLYGIPFDPKAKDQRVTVASMRLSHESAQTLAYSAQVESLNHDRREEALREATGIEAKKLVEDEFEVLRLTNEYRQLFGLHKLLANPRLWTASHQHAEYMNGMKAAVHDQPSAALKTPWLRAKKAGYEAEVFENCQFGSTNARDAFQAWIRSSAHHRGILMEQPREIGISRSGDAWVELFGFGDDYLQAFKQ